jgi:hypothetical protein
VRIRAVKVCRRVRIAERDFEAWVAGALIEPDEQLAVP